MESFRNIKLNGWRQFEHIDIEFDSNVNVLTGPNGCGKTTILNVLARHFGWNINFISTPFFSSSRKEKIWSDIRKAIESDFKQTEAATEVGSIEYTNDQICKLIVPQQKQAQYSLNYQNQLGIAGLNIPSHRPVVSYFQIQNIPTNPKTNQQRHQEFQQLLFQTYGSDHVRNPGVVLKESLVSLALFGYGNEFVQPNAEYKLLFDEFQDILKIREADEAIALLRSKIQFHRKIPYIFVGSIRHKMDEIFTSPGSPFFKSAIPITIDPLSYEEFSRFLTRRFQSGRRKVIDETLKQVFEIANNITGDVQQLCEVLWEVTPERDAVSPDKLKTALELIFTREQKSYETFIGLLTDFQFKCLTALAMEGGKSVYSMNFVKAIGPHSSASVNRAITRMIDINILFKSGKEIRFVNPFFKIWLLPRGR